MAAKTDYTHAPWLRSPLPTTKVGSFEGFIEALRRGEVSTLDRATGTNDVIIENNPNRWSVPVYDFGELLNGAGDGALDPDLVTGLMEDAPDCCLLPAESCVFLFRDASDPIRGAFTKLVRVDGRLGSGKPNVTFTCAHVQRHLRYADMTLHPGYWSVLQPSDELAEGEYLAHIACRLLANWRDNFEVRDVQNYRTAKINAKRSAANQTPIQTTQTIHITEQRVVYLRDQIAVRSHAKTVRVMPQHPRNITGRWIYPKTLGARQFKPYQRNPQVIMVNKGRAPRAAQFRVVP